MSCGSPPLNVDTRPELDLKRSQQVRPGGDKMVWNDIQVQVRVKIPLAEVPN